MKPKRLRLGAVTPHRPCIIPQRCRSPVRVGQGYSEVGRSLVGSAGVPPAYVALRTLATRYRRPERCPRANLHDLDRIAIEAGPTSPEAPGDVLLGALVFRVLEDLVGRGVLNQLSGPVGPIHQKKGGVVRSATRLLHVVRDNHNRVALA